MPLLIGLTGATGTGKTLSALRLATGIARVTEGPVYCVDTEHRRSTLYADDYPFELVDMAPPFSPLDYLDAIRYCLAQKPGVIVVDSMTHEHEGQGGVLEWHDEEAERIAKLWQKNVSDTQFAAWQAPKRARVKLMDEVVHSGVHMIFCFRAKERLKQAKVNGKTQLVDQGWMPIGGDEIFYEMFVHALLIPGENGMAHWRSPKPGESFIAKLPEKIERLIDTKKQLCEEHGEVMARFAMGGAPRPEEKREVLKNPAAYAKTVGAIKGSKTMVELAAIIKQAHETDWSELERQRIREAKDERAAQLGRVANDGVQ